MTVLRVLASSAMIVALGAPAPSFAEPPAKEQVAAKYREGERAFVLREYARSAEAFMEAFAMSPHPNALSNASNAYERAGDLARAATCSLRIARDFPSSPLAIGALQRVARFRKQLVELEIKIAAGGTDLRIDGEPLEYDHPFVSPGRHELRAKFPTGEGKATVDSGAGSSIKIEIEAPPEPAKPVVPPPPPPPPPEAAPAAPPLHPAFFFVGVGLSLAAGGTLAWSGADTLAKRDRFDQELTQDAHDDGVTAQTRTNVLIGVTAGLSALTLAAGLFLTDWRPIGVDNPTWTALRHVQVGASPDGMRAAFWLRL